MSTHEISRVRHALACRLLTVRSAERRTPNTIRVTLAGDALEGFVSMGHDDHVKLIFPRPGEREPVMPEVGANGVSFPEGVERPPMRDYTPRRFDAAAKELEIDFALHDAGPATAWARQAVPGQRLGVAGPRGSFVVPDDFDWYLFAGDETALPAIARRLEELRAAVRAIVVAVVAGAEEEQRWQTAADADVRWVHRPLSQASDPEPLRAAVRAVPLPEGDGFVWIAGESATARLLREDLVKERGLPGARVRASGYWKHGQPNVHESHGD